MRSASQTVVKSNKFDSLPDDLKAIAQGLVDEKFGKGEKAEEATPFWPVRTTPFWSEAVPMGHYEVSAEHATRYRRAVRYPIKAERDIERMVLDAIDSLRAVYGGFIEDITIHLDYETASRLYRDARLSTLSAKHGVAYLYDYKIEENDIGQNYVEAISR